VDWPRSHEGRDVLAHPCTKPTTARDTQRARHELGFQWTWNEVINTIKAEIKRVLSAVPTPDPGPWYP